VTFFSCAGVAVLHDSVQSGVGRVRLVEASAAVRRVFAVLALAGVRVSEPLW
jgi:hypothetical protein